MTLWRCIGAGCFIMNSIVTIACHDGGRRKRVTLTPDLGDVLQGSPYSHDAQPSAGAGFVDDIRPKTKTALANATPADEISRREPGSLRDQRFFRTLRRWARKPRAAKAEPNRASVLPLSGTFTTRGPTTALHSSNPEVDAKFLSAL